MGDTELGVVLRLLCLMTPEPFLPPVPFCDPGGMVTTDPRYPGIEGWMFGDTGSDALGQSIAPAAASARLAVLSISEAGCNRIHACRITLLSVGLDASA